MWNKREEELAAARAAGLPASVAPSVSSSPSVSDSPRSTERAAIGPSITIVGDLTGEEDLTILGKVEGKVNLPQNSVTIGRSARVTADIHAKVVSVEGEVRGNLIAAEQILIRKTATMLGNLTAPRVGLEDGCRFKGSVDMEMPAERARASAASAQPQRAPEPAPKAEAKPVEAPAKGNSGAAAKAEQAQPARA
jgi:cytoskeletal protein CcmA (bactofilin family)